MSAKILAAFALSVGGLAATAPVFAQPHNVEELTVIGRRLPRGERPETLSEVVSYADLNLATTPGRRALDKRIATAAHDVCMKLHQSAPEDRAMSLNNVCENTAIHDAQPQVNVAVARAKGKSQTSRG